MTTDADRDYERHRRAALGVPESVSLLEAALKRGTKRSRLRSFDVVCPADHRLLEVFIIGRLGPLVLGQRPRYESEPDAPVNGQHHAKSRERSIAKLLAEMRDTDEVQTQCVCREGRIPVGWLRQQMSNNRRRAVWTGEPV